MELNKLPPFSLGFLRREHKRLQYLFTKLTGYTDAEDFTLYRDIIRLENKEDPSHFPEPQNPISEDQTPSGEQTVRIATNILKVLNKFMSDENSLGKTIPWMRKNERDENGERAFFLSHPIKVAVLCFDFLPESEDISTSLPIEEINKLNQVRENPYEVAVTAFLHDFVEDIFDGEFDIPNKKGGKTARTILLEILQDPVLQIPIGAQKRIFNRVVTLTKPPQRYSSHKKTLTTEGENNQYLTHYETYLKNIINSNDALSQYIKVIDILQNAQSQKTTKKGSLREKKSKLQAQFIQKVFPRFSEKLMKEQAEFFEKLSDQNLVKELQREIRTRIEDVIKPISS